MIRKDAWEESELQVLYDLVNEGDWFELARDDLPFRTENAIRTKMSNLRAEAGIVPKPHGPRSMSYRSREKCQAKQGSDKLLAALLDMVA